MVGATTNGTESPEFDDINGEGSHGPRSASPAGQQVESLTQSFANLNGRPRSPSSFSTAGSVVGAATGGGGQGGTKDSFLNYFFGKDGPGQQSLQAPTPSIPRSIPSDFTATVKRNEMANVHMPQHVTPATYAAPPPLFPQDRVPNYDDPPTFVSNNRIQLILSHSMLTRPITGGTCFDGEGTNGN